MTQQHDVDQRDQFPEEAFTKICQLRQQAVDQGDRDRQRDERHHAGFAFLDFRYGHFQKGYTAVAEDDQREDEGDPVAAGEGRHAEAQPALQGGTVEQHRDGQQQAPPEAGAEHHLVAAVICAVAECSCDLRGFRGPFPAYYGQSDPRVSSLAYHVPLVDRASHDRSDPRGLCVDHACRAFVFIHTSFLSLSSSSIVRCIHTTQWFCAYFDISKMAYAIMHGPSSLGFYLA